MARDSCHLDLDGMPINAYEDKRFLEDFLTTDAVIIDYGISDEEYEKYEQPLILKQSLTAVELQEKTSEPSNVFNATCKPVSIKLVDCFKYPWYYTKYKQHILRKTCSISKPIYINKQVYCEDSVKNHSLKRSTPDKTSNIKKITAINSMLENKHMDKKLMNTHKTIDKKNLTKIDLQKNQGLVGMKVRPLSVNYTFVESPRKKKILYHNYKITEKKDIKVNKSYVKAVNKTLGCIGTTITPIYEEIPKIEPKEQINNKSKNDLQNIRCTLNISPTKDLKEFRYANPIRTNDDVINQKQNIFSNFIQNNNVSVDNQISVSSINIKSYPVKHHVCDISQNIYNNKINFDENQPNKHFNKETIMYKPMPKSKKLEYEKQKCNSTKENFRMTNNNNKEIKNINNNLTDSSANKNSNFSVDQRKPVRNLTKKSKVRSINKEFSVPNKLTEKVLSRIIGKKSTLDNILYSKFSEASSIANKLDNVTRYVNKKKPILPNNIVAEPKLSEQKPDLGINSTNDCTGSFHKINPLKINKILLFYPNKNLQQRNTNDTELQKRLKNKRSSTISSFVNKSNQSTVIKPTENNKEVIDLTIDVNSKADPIDRNQILFENQNAMIKFNVPISNTSDIDVQIKSQLILEQPHSQIKQQKSAAKVGSRRKQTMKVVSINTIADNDSYINLPAFNKATAQPDVLKPIQEPDLSRQDYFPIETIITSRNQQDSKNLIKEHTTTDKINNDYQNSTQIPVIINPLPNQNTFINTTQPDVMPSYFENKVIGQSKSTIIQPKLPNIPNPIKHRIPCEQRHIRRNILYEPNYVDSMSSGYPQRMPVTIHDKNTNRSGFNYTPYNMQQSGPSVQGSQQTFNGSMISNLRNIHQNNIYWPYNFMYQIPPPPFIPPPPPLLPGHPPPVDFSQSHTNPDSNSNDFAKKNIIQPNNLVDDVKDSKEGIVKIENIDKEASIPLISEKLNVDPPVSTKTKMLTENKVIQSSDKVGFEKPVLTEKVGKAAMYNYRPGPLSKKLKVNNTILSNANNVPSLQYSPSILPIPTYGNILSDKELYQKPATVKKNNKNSLLNKRNIRGIHSEINTSKKISLEEYMMRKHE